MFIVYTCTIYNKNYIQHILINNRYLHVDSCWKNHPYVYALAMLSLEDHTVKGVAPDPRLSQS